MTRRIRRRPLRPSVLPSLSVLSVVLSLGVLWLGPARPAGAADGGSGATLERAQALLDDGQAEQALALLDPLPRDRQEKARALLLKSTAEFMLGNQDEGRADLDRSLELDPSQRQGWLNRAGLDIAEQDYDGALEALEQARRLDPGAEDNHLNLGAVLLLQGKIGDATQHFERYLERAGDRADAYFLVAKNYAGRGYARLAVENLRRAVVLDERYRLLARTDPAFGPIAESPELRELLETDSYTPPTGARRALQSFDAAYDGGDGPLLSAVLAALRTLGEAFDPRVEVAPGWAVIHGDRMRIKISQGEPSAPGAEDAASATASALIEVSAAPDAFDAQAWSKRTDRLFREIRILLAERRRPQEPPRGSW
jgi:tetratricopeptide (TPR) repeat protein